MTENFVSSETRGSNDQYGKVFIMQQCADAPDEARNRDQSLDETVAIPDAPQDVIAQLPGVATQLIGERIRRMYASLAREPVPDELLKLIRQLEAKEKA
jgi:hypothetical protein